MKAGAAGARPTAGQAGRAPGPDIDPWDLSMIQCGYAWCRPCREWHRPPECAIDQDGVPELDWPVP